jgi:gluconokinase
MGHMSARATVVALDIGTSSCRAGLFDAAGHVVRGMQARTEYELTTSAGGVAVLEARCLYAAVEAVLDELHRKAGERLRRAAAVGVSCFFHSLVGLDPSGRADTPIMSWADTTSGAMAAQMRASLNPDEVRDRTGCELAATYWPARIANLRKSGVEVAGWAGFPDLLMERLVGRRAVSVSMASATGLLDRRSLTWDAPLLSEVGLGAESLPPIVLDGEPLGTIVPDLRRRWPELADVPWLAPWGDGACSNVGVGCLSPERAALMIGTSGAMRTVVADAVFGPEAASALPLIPAGLFGFRLGNHETLLGGHLSEGGGVVGWLARLLGQAPAALEQAAAAMEADAHGLTVLPYAAGERAPGYRSDARGWFGGLSLATDAAALYRATLESIALRFMVLDDRLAVPLGARPDIVATGAALQASPLWQQIVADALGRPIEVSPVAEASSRGAALLALRSSGAVSDIRAVAMGEPGRIVEPSAHSHARYRAALERQEAVYRRLFC